MDRIKIVIVEDEFVIAEDIRSHLEMTGYDVMNVFERADKTLAYLQDNVPDLLLVDIRLNGNMDGIQLVEELQKKVTIPVVYITANSDTATYGRARQTNPHAFLVKPFTPANLIAAVDLALYHFSNETTPVQIERPPVEMPEAQPFIVNHSLFIRANGRYKKVNRDSILFVAAAGSYSHVQTVSERYTLSHNLSHFQKKSVLPSLLRIHRSYIVNLDKVDSFAESYVQVGEHRLPLSDHYRADFLAKVNCL